MTAPPPAFTSTSFDSVHVSPQVVAQIVATIITGSPVCNSLSRLNTLRGAVAFPRVTELDDPEWVDEMGLIPLLGSETDAYLRAAHKLAGTVLISLESIEDSDFPVTQQTEQVLRDSFSAKLDRDIVNGSGQDPIPEGLESVAAAVAGDDLWAATTAAKAEINGMGGSASHIALSPAAIGAEEGRRDEEGRPLWPDGLSTFAGLAVISAPAVTGQPLVYDSGRLWLVVRRDFSADLSREYAPAFDRYAAALRLVGRFNVACPDPGRSLRKLNVGGTSGASAAKATRKSA
jgi:HK97 family phage major capsid protein